MCQVTVRTSAHIMYEGRKRKTEYLLLYHVSFVFVHNSPPSLYLCGQNAWKKKTKHIEVYEAALRRTRTSIETSHVCTVASYKDTYLQFLVFLRSSCWLAVGVLQPLCKCRNEAVALGMLRIQSKTLSESTHHVHVQEAQAALLYCVVQ